MKIEDITIVGGTHGNENTGIVLLECLTKRNSFDAYPSLNIKTFLANPKACADNVRFVDTDLNRSFTIKDLENASLSGYEAGRAREINEIIGPKGGGGDSLIIDVHTTTSNMGITLVITDVSSFNLRLSAFVKSVIPQVKICTIPPKAYEGNEDHPYLNSITKYGVSIEVGPIANSIVRHDILEQTKDALDVCLTFVQKTNDQEPIALADQLEIFEYVKTVEYPMDKNGRIDAFIHKDLQDTDFMPLGKGDPIFEKINGEIIRNEEGDVLYPAFINEAAYYYKNYAFTLNKKISVNIS